MKPEDLFWLVLGVAAVAAEFVWQHREGVVVLVALGIGLGIMNNLAALTAELHAELDALNQLLESRLRQLNADDLQRSLDPICPPSHRRA